MLHLINTPGYETVSRPAQRAVEILKRVKEATSAPVVAEVGVGIGATTVELLSVLDGQGTLHLFDYGDVLDFLIGAIEERGLARGVTLVGHANSRLTFDSYAWTLARMVRDAQASDSLAMFDLAFLDGAHALAQDAPSCSLLKEMMKPSGYLIFDDMYWTFSASKTLNPEKNPEILARYTMEQITTPHVELVVRALMNTDPRYEEIFVDDKRRPRQSIFRRKDGNAS